MPIASNIERVKERLALHPLPSVPPQTRWSTREFVKRLGRTPQSAYNWAFLGSGPPRTMGRNRRGSYRVADVLFWLEGPASPSAEDRIRAFLAQHMRLAMHATGLMKAEAGAGVRDGLARLDALSGGELEAVCDALDRVRTPWPKAKAAVVIGTGEVAANG